MACTTEWEIPWAILLPQQYQNQKPQILKARILIAVLEPVQTRRIHDVMVFVVNSGLPDETIIFGKRNCYFWE